MGCDPVPEIFRREAPGKSREENAADLGNMSGISRDINLYNYKNREEKQEEKKRKDAT